VVIGQANEILQAQLAQAAVVAPVAKVVESSLEALVAPVAPVAVEPATLPRDEIEELETLPDSDLARLAVAKLDKIDGRWKRDRLIQELVKVGARSSDVDSL
jgi:hypothetical protein